MDDLLGEDWKAASKPGTTVPLQPANNFNYNVNALQPTSQPSSSGRVTPQTPIRPSSTVNGAKSNASDQFGSLLALKSQKSASNLSIQERQKQLLEEKRRQQEQNSQLWDNLGSGRAAPEIRRPSPATAPADEDEDDILAAFNKNVPVDNSSFYPPPSLCAISGRSTPAVSQTISPPSVDLGAFEDDDDPFGLGMAPQRNNGHVHATASVNTVTINTDDDDILGDLGKPILERPAPKPKSQLPQSANTPPEDAMEDQGVAELVDMGFPADNARTALAESGGDVQGAVGWLLQQAHEESKQKAKNDTVNGRGSSVTGSRSPNRRNQRDGASNHARSAVQRQDSRSPVSGEKDAAQIAQELGNRLFKSAGSLWKASQKQMAKTMSDFQQERNPSQPKWMQDSYADTSKSNSQRRAPPRTTIDATDEAAMLDAPREARPSKPAKPSMPELQMDLPSRGRSPLEDTSSRSSSQPRFMHQAAPQQDRRPAAKLSRQAVEEQSAQAYVSPARRKTTTPKPEPQPEPEVDLFGPAPTKSAPAPIFTSRPAPPSAAIRAPSAPPRPQPPPRNIPSISPAALSTSSQHRKVGSEAFKRGDYAAAHESYSAALAPLPESHPITIIVLCNRSLTALKTGDAKMAVSDADRALAIIGVGQGFGETIDVGGGEGEKDMRDFFGKALMRKAEALEHMEKWADAAAVWKQAIGSGVGGAVSLRGRDRCEKAGAPKPATAPKPAAVRPAASSRPAATKSNLQRPAVSTASSAEAVKKLRAAHAAADKADDEKFALSDQVDARLTAWKGGKADNLRALLQSLDTVLWPEAGWKKVGMSDLIVANKVKIIYMKAIAKVHPDKISQDATIEQHMISSSVFSTLNEAWDKFKADNDL